MRPPRLQVDRRHDAAIADRDHPVAVDHRPAADVGQRRHRAAAAAAREIVAPERAAGHHVEGQEIAGRVGRDHHVAEHGGRGAAEEARGFLDAGVRPEPAAVIRGDRRRAGCRW